MVYVSDVLGHQAFAMAGALAWQVTKSNKKFNFFLGEFARVFARVLPYGVPCPALSLCFLLDSIYSKKSMQRRKIL